MDDNIVKYISRAISIKIISVFIALGVMMCSSCTRTVYVPQTSIQHDSIYITKVKKDSVYLRDSVYIHEKNDTVFLEKWHTKYIERLSTDTLYIEKSDTIREAYPVEKPLSYSEKVWMKVGQFGTILLSMVIVVVLGYLFRKRFLGY